MDTFLIIFIIILLYILLLFTLKKLNIGKKESSGNCNNCCPNCKSPLNRIRRIKNDKIIHYITFKMFDSKRYRCNECGWAGLRWEDKFKS